MPVNIKVPTGRSEETPLSMENKEEERKKSTHAQSITLLEYLKKVYSSTMLSMNMRLPDIATGQLRKSYTVPGIR